MATATRAMRLFTAQVDEPDLQDLIKNLSENANNQIRAVLEFARSDILTFLRGYTNVYRPPRYERKFRLDSLSRRVSVTPEEQIRPAHPGGWADVTNALKDGYYSQVNWVDGSWQLLVGNRDPDAVFVEAMDGYFVVQGIMEPKGPVAQSIRRAIKALGLTNWKIAGDTGAADAVGLLVSPKSGSPTSQPPDLSPWR